MHARQLIATTVFALLCADIRAKAATDTNDLFELEVTTVGQGGGSAILDMTREKGIWQLVLVGHRAYGSNAQWGYVVSNEVADTTMKFDIAINWNGDAWMPTWYGSCHLNLTKGAGDVWFGEAQMTDHGKSVVRTATARIKPPRPVRYPNWRPVEPNEHPRILVRKYEIPRLRERLKTPFGQEALRLMQTATNDLLSLAMLYCLTGDKSYADRTCPLFEKAITIFDGGHVGLTWRGHQRSVGMALDLCYDGLNGGLRGQVEEYLSRFTPAGIDKLNWLSSGMNTHPCCNYYGPIIGSFAIGSLFFVGKTGPEPPEPIAPMSVNTGSDALSKLAARYASKEKGDLARQEYENKLAARNSESAWWKNDGGQDQETKRAMTRMWYQMYRHYRLGIGDGGFQSETYAYSTYAHNNPVTYGAMYQRVFGRDPSALSDATHYLPRQMMSSYFPLIGPSDRVGRGYGQEINGGCGVQPTLLAESFNLIPDQYRPGMHWVWNHLTGVTNEASVTKALAASPVFAFVNYPLESKPAHPRESMPLTWQAPTRGLYLFRSGWEGKDEFISQVFSKSTPIGGHNQPNAGTFRVFGLGHAWVAQAGSKGIAERELQSVVVLPEDACNTWGCGRVTWARTGPDGSGEVTVNYDYVYGQGVLREVAKEKVEESEEAPEAKAHLMTRKELEARKRKAARGPSRAGLVDQNFVFYPQNLEPGSIKGWRAVAFDYSGKSGAPCLMAMVDKVDGGKSKRWAWQVPIDKKEKLGVKIEDRSFSLDHGEANMRATFVAPAKVVLSHNTNSITVFYKGSSAREGSIETAKDWDRDQISATGEKGDEGLFIMVATFQKGKPPEVKVEGEGLAAVVTVGEQKIRFVGDRIVVGQ